MSLPAVIFDDLEAWGVNALDAALSAREEPYTEDVFVSNGMDVDASGDPIRHDRMVIVRRDGGPRLDVVREAARLGVNVYGPTEADALDLARMVGALLWSLPDGDPVCKVTQTGGPVWIPDESGTPRVFLSFELIARGSDLA